MDVSFNNVLESTRKYFQGVPTSPNNSVGGSAASSVGNSGPNHPGAATPVQPPQHGFQNNPPPTVPSSSPTVLSYWPPTGSQRSKDTVVVQTPPSSHAAIQSQNHYVQNQSAGKSPSHVSQAHTVYNGGRLQQEAVQNTNYHSEQTNQPSQRHQHNLPPIAALSSVSYHSSRTASRESSSAQSVLYHRQSSQLPQQHLPLPSISQINIHNTSKQSSLSPRTIPPQYRTPDYAQSAHSSYSPSALASRDSARVSYPQIPATKYQHSASPVVSSASLTYNYPHNTSIPSTISAASYPQSTSSSTSSVYVNSSHQQRQQQLQQQQQNIQIHIQQQQQLMQQQSHHSGSQSHNQQQNNQPTLTQQHQQALQQHQASLYQQSLQHNISSRQVESVKDHHQQQPLKSHQYSANVVQQQQQQHQQQHTQQLMQQHQQQQQPQQQHQQQHHQQQQQRSQSQTFYTSTSSSSNRPSSQITPTTQTTNHQRVPAIPSRQTSGILKRESPLDLSVKTVRQSADSTAKDESENVFNNVAAYHSHEMLHMRTKTPPKASNSRGSAVLPPLQLPTSVVYPTFETHANANANPTNPPQSMTGAPKVDFLPNFQQNLSPQLAGNTPTINYHNEIKKRHRKTSSHSQQSAQNHYSYQSSLPHMGSFKKTSIPAAAYEHHNKQAQFYPATGPPSQQRTPTTISHPSSLGALPSLPSATLNQYAYDPTKRGNDSTYDYLGGRSSNHSSSGHSASPIEGNYPLAKRPSSSDLRHPLPAKITKVDTWRQTIDQQIEQRLNSYASSRSQQPNGVTNDNSGNSETHRQHSQTITSYSQQSLPNSHSSSQNHSLLDRQQALYGVHRVPSNPSLSVPYYPSSNLPQYANQNASPRSQETYQHSAHSRLPVLPNNGAADKRVLSILRSSLEIKEARNLQLQQQQQQLHQENLLNHGKVYHSLEPRANPSQLLRTANQNKSSATPTPPVGRHNLPPFGAIALERTSTPPYPGYKLPKAVDSVRLDNEQNLSREKIANSQHPRPGDIPHKLPRNDVMPKSAEENNTTTGQEAGGEFDGLAAFLAARIRTKAELKQVGPSMGADNTRTPTPASSVISGSNSSVHSPRTTPGIFSPPPASQAHQLASAADMGKIIPSQDGDQTALPSGSGGSTSSPPKLIRERGVINSPRRRLFSRPDDESGGGVVPGAIVAHTSGGTLLPSREPGGLRSSSETSVFDFRESDSEGEMPVLERQSLHEMRRDRDKRILEKQQATALVNTEQSSKPTKEPGNAEDGDPFWSETCSMFLEQLQTGAGSMRRRGRRKKMKDGTTNEKSLKVEPKPETQTVIAHSSDGIAAPIDDSLPQVDNTPSSDLPLVTETDVKSENIVCDIVTKEVKEEIHIKKEEVPVPVKSENICVKKLDNSVKKVEATVKTEVSSKKEEKSVKKDNEVPVKKENEFDKIEKCIKKEDESSDEDLPLSQRQNEFKKEKEESLKMELAKKVVSESDGDSSAEENNDSVATRLRLRKPKESSASEVKHKKKQRSREQSCSPKKTKKQAEDKKKPSFGDGTDFRPGWEEELYKYKRSLRMPARLINISRPPTWPRISVSLPDLDPDSPMTLDSLDFSTNNKKHDSDIESLPSSNKIEIGDKDSGKANDENSFLNRLVKRYGGKGKKSLRKNQEKDNVKESKGPKIIPQKDGPELLPTPSLDLLIKSPNKKLCNSATGKSSKGNKMNKLDFKTSDCENDDDSVYLGYFRKQTVAGFREAFVRHNGGFATEHELPPIVLKSRTRTQTRVLKQQATIREVFGEDRPASAPPAGCREESNDKSNTECEEKKTVKAECSTKVLMRKRGNSNASSSGTRAGLRSAAVLRSNKAVLKSKQQLLHGDERRKRNTDLLKAYASVKKQQHDTNEADLESVNKAPSKDKSEMNCPSGPLTVKEKSLKLRTIRRKLKSSGFDYIRKKKKQQQKKEGEKEREPVKERRKGIPLKPNPESEEDIQNEIKGWVINKGLGETILHRAARLGYTDVAAYCLEKMDHNPSPRDNAGYTPLHEACSRGHLDIARLLLMYGANVSDSAHSGIRPLHEAVENGYTEIIRLLLSYGADPLLATYSGHTPLSLANDPDTKALMQHHLADVQGLPAPPWNFTSPADDPDPMSIGYNCFSDIPPPEASETDETEVEFSEMCTPNLYQLLGEPHTDRWVLFQEIGPVLRVKTREALIKQLGQSHRNDFRDLKMTDFYDMAKCCSLLGVGDNILNPKAHKVTLVKYTEKVRSLLCMDKILVSGR